MREEGGAGASLGGRRGREIEERRARQQRSLSPGGVREIEGRRGRGSFWRREGKGTKEEEGIDRDGVSLGPRVTGARLGLGGRPKREEESAGLAGLGSPSPLFIL